MKQKYSENLKLCKNFIILVLGALIILDLLSIGPIQAQEKCKPLDKKKLLKDKHSKIFCSASGNISG